jgi:DMSO reductase anchor subunit
VLARRHARRLRAIAAGLVLLGACLVLAPVPGRIAAAMAAWAAVATGMAGLFVERWLFFAEARHAVMAYYAR